MRLLFLKMADISNLSNDRKLRHTDCESHFPDPFIMAIKVSSGHFSRIEEMLLPLCPNITPAKRHNTILCDRIWLTLVACDGFGCDRSWDRARDWLSCWDQQGNASFSRRDFNTHLSQYRRTAPRLRQGLSTSCFQPASDYKRSTLNSIWQEPQTFQT